MKLDMKLANMPTAKISDYVKVPKKRFVIETFGTFKRKYIVEADSLEEAETMVDADGPDVSLLYEDLIGEDVESITEVPWNGKIV